MQGSQAILDYWFGPEGDREPPGAEYRKRWWVKDPANDRYIAQHFGADLERAARGELDAWAERPHGRLALVILLDQFSRNIHRGTGRMFAYDGLALGHAQQATATSQDAQVGPYERVFFYMPFMHSESLEDQRRAYQLFEQLANDAGADGETFRRNLDFARRHMEIIERFGRFPHRNEPLGRPSTPEELEFLKQPGSSF